MLDAWAASTDRLREDANAEADLATGAYRDAVVVELAQNAADAAARAGVPGDLLLRLDDGGGPHGALVAANTGAALDAAGVRALASLRASAKREAAGSGGVTVGRFGVGFAAVLALSDEPRVLSTGGGVAFSRARTLEAVAATGSASLRAEVGARSGDVPVLRLPWPDTALPPDGYDTAVVLPLRDARARESALAALSQVGDVLLLALPALRRVTVELPGAPSRVHDDVASRWRTLRRTGSFSGADLDGLPVEERQRAAASGWSVTWALPLDAAPATGALPGVLLAPTPTDEPLPWPAVLVLGAPLDATRRALAPGPAAAVVLAEAAGAYADLLELVAADPDLRAAAGRDALDLVPTGLPSGGVDADLRVRLMDLLGSARVLHPVEALGAAALRPRDAVVLDGPLGDDPASLAPLAPLVGGLVAAPLRHRALLAALGVSVTTVADVVDAMPLTADAPTWRGWAEALSGFALDPAGREQLALLPVPLAGGASVRGVRGVLLPPGAWGAGENLTSLSAALSVLAAHGLRVVDPGLLDGGDGATDLLLRLGAVAVSARAVLEDPAVARAIAVADDPGAGEVGPGEVADAVLALVARALEDGGLRPGDLPALADLLLPAEGSDLWPAAGLVVPGSAAAGLLDPGEVAPLAAHVLEEWGAAALQAVGVASTLGVVRLGEVDSDDPPLSLLDVDGGEEWLQQACPENAVGGAVVAEVVLVRDLDLVLPERRADLLALVAADPVLRAAVVEPVRVVTGGAATSAASHAAWWLGRELGAGARADPQAPAGLLAVLGAPDSAVAAADPALRRAMGTVSGWEDVPVAAWGAVLDRSLTAAPDVPGLLGLWSALAAAAREGDLRAPPDRLLALDAGDHVVAVSADDVVVVDEPCWLQVPSLGARVVVGEDDALALADALDVDLASERGAGALVTSTGRERQVPALVTASLPGCPPTWKEHERLTIGVAGAHADVSWWVEAGVVHADGPGSLGCGLAAATGSWGRRHVLAEVLEALRRGDEAAAVAALVLEAAGR